MYGQQQTLGPLISSQRPELGSLREEGAQERRVAEQQAKGNSVVRVSVEVRCRAARFRVGVQASSIQRAVDLVKGFYSASDAKVVFPIDAEGFFVGEALAAEGLIEGGKPQEEEELAA
jgi:hypothetical protein